MLLALWWYFWTQLPPTGGPQFVAAQAQHFVVALVLAQAFAPPSARSHALVLERAAAASTGDGQVLTSTLQLPGVRHEQVEW